MKITTANFNSANASLQKEPVIIVEFNNVTRKYSSGTFANITANHKKYISAWSLTPTSVDLPKNNIRIGKASFTLKEDSSLDVATRINTDLHNNKILDFKFGYQGLNDTDFISFPEWKIVEIQPNQDDLSWTFLCEDVSRFISTEICRFEQRTALNGAILTSSTTITVDSTTDFINPSNIPSELKEYVHPAIRIDNEIIAYTSITATTFVTNVGGRAKGNTDRAAHDDDATVEQVVAFAPTSTPAVGSHSAVLKVLLHMWLSTETGNGHAYYDLTSYDSNFRGFGLGLTAAEVDIDGIENLDGLIWYNTASDEDAAHPNRDTGEVCAIRMNALKFEIERVLTPAGCFKYLDANGKWTLGTFDPIVLRQQFNSVHTFTDNEVTGFDYRIDWNPINTITFRNLVNQATEGERESFALTTSDAEEDYKLDESVTDYGQSDRTFKITNHFAFKNVNLSDAWIEFNYLRRWFYIFGNPIARFTMDTHIEHIIFEPNDLIQLTLTKETDLQGTAARGWTNRQGMITGQTIQLNESGSFVVRYTGFIWDVLNKVDAFETDGTAFVAGDFDDSTLDPGGTNGSALLAEDAFIDFSPALASQDAFYFKIQWTNPNTGANEHNLFSIAIHSQSPAATDIFTAIAHRRIRYSTNDALVITREFYVVDENLTATTIDRLKFDVFDLRQTDGAAPAGADEPQNMTITNMRPQNLNKTISLL